MRIIATVPEPGQYLEAEIQGMTLDELKQLLSDYPGFTTSATMYARVQDDVSKLEELNPINTKTISDDSITQWIRNLGVSAEMKNLLEQLCEIVVRVGNKVFHIGRKIIEIGIKLARQYPNTVFALIVASIIGLMIGAIPILGGVLGPILLPLLIALGLAFGFWTDMNDKMLETKIGNSIAVFSPLERHYRIP